MSIALYGIPLGLFVVLTFVFDFNGLYGQDSHEYLRFGVASREYLETGAPTGDFYWPKTYSQLGALLSYTGLTVEWSLRLISLLGLYGMLFFTNRIIRILFQKDGSLFLILGAATQVYFVRMGILVMTDTLCGMFIMGTFYFYVKTIVEKKNTAVYWMLLFALFAFFSRYASIPIIILPVCHASFVTVRKWKPFVQLLVLIGGLTGIVGIVLLNNRVFDEIFLLMNEWDMRTVFSRSYNNREKFDSHWVPNILYAFGNFLHIGFLSLGVFLLPFYRKIEKPNAVILISALVYILFIAGLSIQNYRFLVITHPLILIVLFPAFEGLKNWLVSKKIAVPFFIGVVLFNIAFFTYSFRKTYAVHTAEKEVVIAIKDMKYDGLIYTFYVDQSFPTYHLKNEVKNLWLEEYQTFEIGALVVFNEAQFNGEWKEHALMKNWKKLNTAYTLEVVKELPNNWNVYRIK